MAGLSYFPKILETYLFFLGSSIGYHAVEGTVLHAFETEAAGCGHLVVLFPHIDKHGALFRGLALFTAFTFVLIEPNAPDATVATDGPVG
jgi:hypothetical protein